MTGQTREEGTGERKGGICFTALSEDGFCVVPGDSGGRRRLSGHDGQVGGGGARPAPTVPRHSRRRRRRARPAPARRLADPNPIPKI